MPSIRTEPTPRRLPGSWVLVFFAVVTPSLIQAQSSAYIETKNVVYAEAHGVGLVMDVFQPKKAPNGLAIIDVVSGAWYSDRRKIRDHKLARVFSILCGRGFTVFAIRPGSVSRFDTFDMVEHLELGLDWVRKNSSTYNIDADRLGLMGASAGGHLACLTTANLGRQDNGRIDPQTAALARGVRAVSVFFPPTDLLHFVGEEKLRSDSRAARIVRRLVTKDPANELSDEALRDRVVRASPALRVHRALPPFLLIHGDADPLVPLEQSKRMVAALKKVDVPVELIVKKGGGHPWFTIAEEVEIMADWLEKRLGAAPSRGEASAKANSDSTQKAPSKAEEP